MNENNFIVCYISPGWPLSAFPNGIVTYIQNIVSGFDSVVTSIIATNKLVNERLGNREIIDLTKFYKNKGVLFKFCNKIFGSTIAPKYIKDWYKEYRLKMYCAAILRGVGAAIDKIDILEVDESFGVAKYLVKGAKLPVVTRIHGPWFIHGPIMHLDKNNDYHIRVEAEGEAIRLSDGVTAPSLDVLNRVRQFYGISLSNAQVIPNPVPSVLQENQWQYKADEKQTILVVGRFDLHKGGDLALDAFRIVASSNYDVELLFVGPDRGVLVDSVSYSFNEYLDAFISEPGIKKRINFLGHCGTDEISVLRKSASVTLMPSRYDNFPMSLLESVAVGSPVVAASVGGMKEIIIDEFNGLLAISESAESMAEKLLQLLDDPEKMQRLSKNAIKDSQDRFSPEVVARQTEMFYRQILDKNFL